MSGRPMLPLALGVAVLVGALAAGVPARSQTPKRGGVLNAMLAEDPPGFSIHESATISAVWPVMPCHSNLVLFDPLKPQETAETVMPELDVPSLVVSETGQNGSDNVILNHKRPPFDNVTVRRAISLAIDRDAYVQGVRHGGAVVGAALMSPPFGVWGLLDKDLRALPGYRGSGPDKAEAKRLLAAAGFGPGKSLRVELVTRAFPIYVDLASFVVDQLRQVGVEATVKQMETVAWFPALARCDYLIGANLTAAGIDDPDAFFYENYRCGSSRNYTDYCSEEMDRLIDLQSQELDRAKRLKLVWEIQRKLDADVARPMLGWCKEYFTQWPHVRNLVPHHSLYNYGRMEQVWLDK